MLAETRRMARDRAGLAENIGLELLARIEIMAKDVAFLNKKVCPLTNRLSQVTRKAISIYKYQRIVYNDSNVNMHIVYIVYLSFITTFCMV